MRSLPPLLLLFLAAFLPAALADEPRKCVWIGAQDGHWDNSANWADGIVPGLPGGNINDHAIFNSPTPNQTISVDYERQVAFITFTGSPGAYTFQGGPLILTATWKDGIRISSSEVKSAQTFNLDIRPSGPGNFGFTNVGGEGASLVFNGKISGADTLKGFSRTGEPVSTLLLGGPGGGQLNGPVADGEAVVLGISRTGKGTWTLTGEKQFSGSSNLAP